jgi:hypothetical protein
MLKWRALLAASVLCTALAACSDDAGKDASTSVGVGDAPSLSVETTAGGVTTAPSVTDPVATDSPAITAAEPLAWDVITAPADCMCSDGSGFEFFVHRADPAKVVFFLEGGGACFDAGTCGPDSTSFKRTVGHDDQLSDVTAGIFDFTNPDNPFKDWSVVYVPYCTGDIFLGSGAHDYGGGVVIQHKGNVDASAALQHLAETFPGATQLVVAGESAGAAPDPLFAGLAADLLPAARITVLADGAGAYPDVPAVNALIGGLWSTQNAVPDWPETQGMTAEQWSLPGLFVKAHEHAPAITFARHDYAFDQTQTFFGSLAGFDADNLIQLIDQNEAEIEKGGVDLLSYISPGTNHTVIGSPAFYTETQNGMSLLDWVTALVAGDTVVDNHCTVADNGCKA